MNTYDSPTTSSTAPEQRDGTDTDRRATARPDSPGRRAIDRMAATPAEIDRLARTLRAEWEPNR